MHQIFVCISPQRETPNRLKGHNYTSNDTSSHSASGCPGLCRTPTVEDRQTDGQTGDKCPVDDIMFFCISPVSPPSGGSSGF